MADMHKQIQLLLHRWGHQINAAANQQHRHIEAGQTTGGPKQTAKTVEGHDAEDGDRRKEGVRNRIKGRDRAPRRAIPGHPGHLALQQLGQIRQGQGALHCLTAPGHPLLRQQAAAHEGRQGPEGMAHQDNPLATSGFGTKRWQDPILFCGEHGLHIGQAEWHRFGPWRWAVTKQGVLNSLVVTAGMVQEHHRPPLASQLIGHPTELGTVPAQPRHQQNPRTWLRLTRRPNLEGQGHRPVGHNQIHVLGPKALPSFEVKGNRPAQGQGQGP